MALSARKGGLFIQRDDEIKFKLQDLAARTFIPFVVREDPQICPGRSADVKEVDGKSTPTEDRGNLLLRNLWKNQTDCILDVRITNPNIRRQSFFLMSTKTKKQQAFLKIEQKVSFRKY